MKVKLKSYTNKKNYKSGLDPLVATRCSSIGEALKHAKGVISSKRNEVGFIGFRIETLEGDLKYKLHNR